MGPFDLITTSETCDNKNRKWGRMVAYQKKYVQEMKFVSGWHQRKYLNTVIKVKEKSPSILDITQSQNIILLFRNFWRRWSVILVDTRSECHMNVFSTFNLDNMSTWYFLLDCNKFPTYCYRLLIYYCGQFLFAKDLIALKNKWTNDWLYVIFLKLYHIGTDFRQ